MRIYNCDDCCKRWFVTINGKECSDPVPIDGVIYVWKGKGTENTLRPRILTGTCKIPTKGTFTIGLNVGNCSGYGNADAYTGWNSSTFMNIEEVPAPQA